MTSTPLRWGRAWAGAAPRGRPGAEPDAGGRARDVLIGLYNRLDQGHDVDAAAVESVVGMAAQPNLDGIVADEVASPPKVMIRTRKKTIVPRSMVQTAYMES